MYLADIFFVGTGGSGGGVGCTQQGMRYRTVSADHHVHQWAGSTIPSATELLLNEVMATAILLRPPKARLSLQTASGST